MQVNNVNLVAAQQMSNNNYVWREILLCFDYSSHYVLVCSHYVLPASASVFVFFILLRGLQWVEFPFFFNLVSWTGNYQKQKWTWVLKSWKNWKRNWSWTTFRQTNGICASLSSLGPSSFVVIKWFQNMNYSVNFFLTLYKLTSFTFLNRVKKSIVCV